MIHKISSYFGPIIISINISCHIFKILNNGFKCVQFNFSHYKHLIFQVISSCVILLSVDQIQEFLSSFLIIAKHSKHCGRNGFTVDFLNTTHYHAHMGCFDNNGHTFELGICLEPMIAGDMIYYKPAGCTAFVTATAICLVNLS